MPRNSSAEPKVMRNCPDTVSMPTPASKRPSDIEMTVLCLASRPSPTNEQKVKRYTAKNSGGPNFSAKEEIIGARNVISSTATSEPMKEEVKAAVSASAALPCCAIGYPSNVVATDQASPGMLNRIEVMAPPNSAPQ